MDEQKKKSLSEISHLFLSSVRENATAAGGGIRPKRIPPGGERVAPRPAVPPVSRTAMSIDLTPEEYARVIEESERVDRAGEPEKPPIGPISALICSQFNDQQLARAKEYARHLSSSGERIGLLHVDANECSVICIEPNRDPVQGDPEASTLSNPRELAEGLEELAWDIDRWILLLTTPGRLKPALLRKVTHWTLLSTCDHDGVVNCYRAIKGLAETPRPRLTLALLNAVDQTEAGKVYRKIAGVCEQFLNWNMEAEPAVEAVDMVAETQALSFIPPRDRAELATGPHWEVVEDFLSRAQEDLAPAMKITPALDKALDGVLDELEEQSAQAPIPLQITPEIKPMNNNSTTQNASRFNAQDVEGDVTDLPSGEVTEAAVLSAVISRATSGLAECPIRPPACPEAALAVGRDRRLVLLAVARKGLGELRSIATAYRWVVENRPLLTMALPQFSIDAHAMPGLKLLVDRADADADLLLPMSENSNITIETYRKLRWAGKTGLLLEAA